MGWIIQPTAPSSPLGRAPPLPAPKTPLSNPQSEQSHDPGGVSSSTVEGKAARSADGAVLEGPTSPTFVGDLPVGEDFVEQDPVGPDVGLEGVGAVVGCLRGRPLHRDFGAAAGGVDVILERNGRRVLRD